MDGNEEFNDVNDLKEFLLFHSETKEKFVLCDGYVEKIPVTTKTTTSTPKNERNSVIKSDCNVNNIRTIKVETWEEIESNEALNNDQPASNNINSETKSVELNLTLKEHMENRFSWVCCSSYFNDFIEYNKHKVQVHHIDEKKCSVCEGVRFSSMFDIEKHYITVHCKLMSFKCFECNYVFGVQSSFAEHKQKCKDSNIMCKQIVESVIDLACTKEKKGKKKKEYKRKKSIRPSTSPKESSYQLICCEEIFTSFMQFNLHKFFEHKIEQLVCGLCFNEEKNTNALYRHYLQAHFPRLQICIDNCKVKKEQIVDTVVTVIESSNRKKEDTLNSTDDDGSSDKDDETVGDEIKCTAQLEGILCQCSTCTKIVNNFQPADCKQIDRTAHMKPYVCKICNQRFTYESRLKRHLKTHVGFKDFPCDICGSSFTKKTSLNKHKLYKHSSNPFKVTCKTCSNTFSCKSSLGKHIRNVHLRQGKNFRVQCSHCLKTFAHSKSLNRHVNEKHLKGNEFICDHCHRTFYDKGILTYHIKSLHLPVENVTCDICGFIASNKSTLHGHKNRKHSQLRFGCEICGKMFPIKKTLEMHQVTHFDDKPFACQTCGKCFKRETNLQQHQYTHSDDRPHVCSVCGQSFRLRTHVKQHMAVHGMIRNHKCFICSKLFSRKGELNIHLADHGV